MADGADRRWFTRVPWHTSCVLRLPDQEATVSCLDISLHGALLHSTVMPADDAPCTLILELDSDGENQVEAECRVVRATGERIGVEFTALELESATHLRNLVGYNTGDPEAVDRELANLRRARPRQSE